MRTLVILNPAAGGGVAADTVRDLLRELPGAELRQSERPGRVGVLAVEAARAGIERVVAAGGDGTVSDMLSALGDAGLSPQVGILPVGTGNDLARSLGLPLDRRAALQVVAAGRTRQLDLIRATSLPATGRPARTHVANAAVGGFCGRISDRMSETLRRRWRNLSYLRAALAELRDLRSHEIRVRSETLDVRLEAMMVIVANGKFAGGRIPLAPDARPDDGWLNVVVLPAVPLHALPPLAVSVLRGTHSERRDVTSFRATEVRIEAGRGFWLNVDGETWCEGGAHFRLLPGRLPVLVP